MRKIENFAQISDLLNATPRIRALLNQVNAAHRCEQQASALDE